MAKNKNTDGRQLELISQIVPQMPEGYYSGDKPNPNLRKFVEEHLQERPYDPENDTYDVPAFETSIETTKATAIYNMHTYWSKKPHDAIRQYIRHYTQPGDLVLDPFCGSGGTALAALMEGRKAIAIDRSPAATFITKNYCTPVDVQKLEVAFEELKKKVKPEIDWLYETRCDRCDGKATTAYTVYSQVFQCPRCLEKVPLFDCVELEGKTAKGDLKKVMICSCCYGRGIHEEIKTSGKKFGAIPVLVSYQCENGCKPAKGQRRHNDTDAKKQEYFKNFDLKKLQEIEEKEIPYWYPKNRMMNAPEDQEKWGVKWRKGTSNFRTVDELFTKRNLWALGLLAENVQKKYPVNDAILFILSSILLKSSRMMAHNSDGIGRIQKGTYYIPQIVHDINVWKFMKEALGDMIAGYRTFGSILTNLIISTSDARDIHIKSDSIDYIFTDPPYANKVQYGELNFIWESWLKLDTKWHTDEIVINEVRGKSEYDWMVMMRHAIFECYRVLKPGRVISLCYHDTSDGTWELLQDIMKDTGFIPEEVKSALYIETKTKTTNQYFGDNVNKRDLLISFRKPRPREAATVIKIIGTEALNIFNEKIYMIIREYLGIFSGSSKDRIYDEIVSRMVRKGEMESHNFDELLRHVAEEVKDSTGVSRWYLKETELDIVDQAESAKEDAAAKKLTSFIKEYIKKNSEKTGVHYSNIFEYFIYAVKDKPRRRLSEWLSDFFYLTTDGTYRLPASPEEEQFKAESRQKGTNRRIKRFIAFLTQNIPIPEHERPSSATLAEWIRHSKRSGLFEWGRLIYEKGGIDLSTLPEEDAVNVEEDYGACIRGLKRKSQ